MWARPDAKLFLIKNLEASSRVFSQVHGNHSSTRGLLTFSAATRPPQGRGRWEALCL